MSKPIKFTIIVIPVFLFGLFIGFVISDTLISDTLNEHVISPFSTYLIIEKLS
tara:strand:+ start:529 stop:687 length:159 start_codon:yes stop_codon:yes gene_type:complete